MRLPLLCKSGSTAALQQCAGHASRTSHANRQQVPELTDTSSSVVHAEQWRSSNSPAKTDWLTCNSPFIRLHASEKINNNSRQHAKMYAQSTTEGAHWRGQDDRSHCCQQPSSRQQACLVLLREALQEQVAPFIQGVCMCR